MLPLPDLGLDAHRVQGDGAEVRKFGLYVQLEVVVGVLPNKTKAANKKYPTQSPNDNAKLPTTPPSN